MKSKSILQLIEVKKKADEDMANNEALEEYKKKVGREMEQLQTQLEEGKIMSDRLDKSKKKLQAEVSIPLKTRHKWVDFTQK